VGKVCPADRIRPAEAFCPARGVVISKQVTYFSSKESNLQFLFVEMCGPQSTIFFETARRQKQLPNSDLFVFVFVYLLTQNGYK
jgi:hypothetical protein